MKNFRIKGRSLFVQGFNAMKQPAAGTVNVLRQSMKLISNEI